MDVLNIVFWVLLAALLVGVFAFLSKTSPKSARSNSSVVAQLTKDALFLAITMAMGFIPNLGYITIAPGVSLTLIHIPVLVGCCCFGFTRGWLYGLFFGVTSWIAAMQSATGFNAFLIYPWVSILPRVVFGLVAGLLYSLLGKLPKALRGRVGIGLIGFLMTLIHTGLVFLDLYIFFPTELTSIFATSSVIGNGLTVAFAVAIGIGALGEAILGGLITAIIGPILKRIGENK